MHIDNLSLEIAYRDFEYGWVYYDIWLRWCGEPVINDAILKRHNEHWAKRGAGAIVASEHRECGILPLLKHVLATNESDYWEGTDPDVLLAIYPDRRFPFLPSKWTLLYEKQAAQAARDAEQKKRAEFGPLSTDLVEIMLFVDVYNFDNAGAYYGDGLCFRISPTRAQLEEFYRRMRAEYLSFKEHHGVDAFNREDYGSDYRESPF
jgi:hypothetical protein